MTFNPNLIDNTDIPLQGLFAIMSHTERALLYSFISQLGNNITVMEIGSALGGAACVIASANPTINVISIEAFHNNIWCWENQIRPFLAGKIENWCKIRNTDVTNYLFWIELINSHFEYDRLGISAFEAITKDFPNIKLLQGESPIICSDWNTPIDVYFEDANHNNPLLNSNINFWTKHIKPNGFIIGHDYDQKPDVKSEFNNLIQQGWNLITKVEQLIILQKPNNEEN